MKHVSRAILFAAIACVSVACGDSPSSPSSSNSARFNLRLTASSFAGGQALLVTFARVRAFRSPGDFTDVALPGNAAQITCDLKKLQSTDGEIAVGPLPNGRYTEVRVLIQSATLYLDNPSVDICAANARTPGGRTAPMALSPGEIVISREFRVEDGADTTIRIGLNTEQSIRAASSGSYTFTPIVNVLSVS
jgi:hypothetical protein